MARFETIYCIRCSKTQKTVNGKCEACIKRDSNKRKSEFSKKSVDEQIEELRQRIEALENRSDVF